MVSCGKCLHKEVCVDYRYYKPNAEKCLNFKEVNVVKTEQTNADRIRVMSDEELCKLLDYELGCPVTGDCAKMSKDCKACWLDWLQHPVE